MLLLATALGLLEKMGDQAPLKSTLEVIAKAVIALSVQLEMSVGDKMPKEKAAFYDSIIQAKGINTAMAHMINIIGQM